MNTVLEVLRAADARLADETTEYEFEDWCACTCGHIYAAAHEGERAAAADDVRNDNSAPYRETLAAITEANPSAYKNVPAAALHHAVSDATIVLAGGNVGEPWSASAREARRAARALVHNAIWMLEERYERQRLDVLAQTRAIVDAAEVPEPVGLAV